MEGGGALERKLRTNMGRGKLRLLLAEGKATDRDGEAVIRRHRQTRETTLVEGSSHRETNRRFSDGRQIETDDHVAISEQGDLIPSNVKDLARSRRDATKQAENLAYSNYIDGGSVKSNGIKKGCVKFGDFSISNMGKTHEGEFMNLSKGEGSNFGGEKSDVCLGQWDALNTQLAKGNTGRTMENDNTTLLGEKA